MTNRNLLGLERLPAAEIRRLLDAAARHAERLASEPATKGESLRGRVVLLGFLEPSTRTRVSFEIAGKRLGADTINLSERGSSLEKGESLADTARTLEAMGADVLVLRHARSGVPAELARRLERLVVVNGGDGAHEHPTQALSDLTALARRGVRLEGLRLAIVGDVVHSRVARSAVFGFTALGAEVTLCGPPSLLPARSESWAREPGRVRVTHRIEEALEGAGAVMALRLQRERQESGLVPSLEDYVRLYRIDPERLERAEPGAWVLHPGPMNRGIEIHGTVADGPRSLVLEQVTAGVAVRCAVLERACGVEARAAAEPARERAEGRAMEAARS